MRKRTLLTILLIGLMLVISLLGLVVMMLVKSANQVGEEDQVTAENVKKVRKVDPHENKGQSAIMMVQNHEVLDPGYIDKVLEFQKKAEEEAKQLEAGKDKKKPEKKKDKKAKEGEGAEGEGEAVEELPEPRMVKISQLVEEKYLEKRFNMSFLERGQWRAVHLDIDGQANEKPNPYFEVYLDYNDEEVTIGPVWVVNVETGGIVSRNDMASFFELTIENAEDLEKLKSKPARVVKAITNHKFDNGIELGGVLLLHFVNREAALRKTGDRIIGWTVNHDFQNYYNAYFQWREAGEARTARFRFDWAEQRFEPKGLVAIDLMGEGEGMKTAEPVSIWPETYENDINIPRDARWKGDTAKACKTKEAKPICDSFAMVLEQQDFIKAVQWLLTTDEESASRFERCRQDKDCRWNPVPRENGLISIKYNYRIEGRDLSIGFQVDPKKNTITPDDEISRWAYWSVTPRT